jgi:23S rRNA-/tRNA-specific pseudouridylate synthase
VKCRNEIPGFAQGVHGKRKWMLEVEHREGDVTAITKYRLLGNASWKNIMLSFVELQPITRRAHQLRMHCFQKCVPIVGDRTYGHFGFNKQFWILTGHIRLLLHPNEVTIHSQCDVLSKSFHAKSKSRFTNYYVDALTM